MDVENKILRRTSNGIIYKCQGCMSYQIEFKNILFNLSIHDFDTFTNYIINLNNKITSKENHIGKFQKNIVIPTQSTSLYILLNTEEISELAYLFSFPSEENLMHDMSIKISYNYSLS